MPKRIKIFLYLFVGIIVFTFVDDSTAAQKTSCPIPFPADQNVECGYLSVPEDRTKLNGRMIQVAYAVVHSHSPVPEADPVVLLNGGPGGPMRFILQGIANYNFLLASRDIILFDPRGVDNSVPNLDCRELEDPFRRSALGEDVLINDWLSISNSCKEDWLEQGIDLSQYNSLNTALDARDLWRELGYEKVNPLSLSYGTVLAQILMREVPDEIRTVILDSPLPLDTHIEPDIPQRVTDALKTLFEKCSQDFTCRAAYPNLPAIYQELRDETIANPIELTSIDPSTNKTFHFKFDADDLGSLISGPPRVLPASIYDLHDGNFDSVIEQQENLLKNLDQFGWGHAFGLVNTVFCTEEMFYLQSGERASSSLPEAGLMIDEVQEAYCQNWLDVPQQPLRPLADANIPTLIFIGEYDTRLPPSYAQRIADALPNAQWYLFPGIGHVVYQSSPCATAMLTNFIVEPLGSLNTECINSSSSPIFDTLFLLRSAFVEPFAKLLISIFSVIIFAEVLTAGCQISRQRFGIAWNMIHRRVGWLAPILTVALTLIVVLLDYANLQNISANPAYLFVHIISLATGVQAALLFAPDDEPAFEIQLVAPRPLAWTILERFSFLLFQQILVGVLFSLILQINIFDWLAPMILFASIGVAIAVITRRSTVGVLFVILIWFAAFTVIDVLIDRTPVLWVIHPFLENTSRYYVFNRWLILLTGILLMMILTAIPRKDETLLFGGIKQRGRAKRTPPKLASISESVDLAPASVLKIYLFQFFALIRFELILQWRRRSLSTSAFALTALPFIGALVSMGSYRSYKTIITLGGLAAETAKSEVTFQMIPYFIIAGLLVYALLIPVVTADVIPSDSQIRVREIINSLPLPRMIYLFGKVFSVWVGVLLMSVAQFAICGLAWWILVAPFHIYQLFEVWLTLLWMGLVNSATVMLLASRSSSRRSILVGVSYAFISVMSIGAGIFLQGHFLKAILPGRPAVMLYYIFVLFVGRLPNTNISPEVLAQYATHADIFYAALAGLAQVIIISIFVWFWHRKED